MNPIIMKRNQETKPLAKPVERAVAFSNSSRRGLPVPTIFQSMIQRSYAVKLVPDTRESVELQSFLNFGIDQEQLTQVINAVEAKADRAISVIEEKADRAINAHESSIKEAVGGGLSSFFTNVVDAATVCGYAAVLGFFCYTIVHGNFTETLKASALAFLAILPTCYEPVKEKFMKFVEKFETPTEPELEMAEFQSGINLELIKEIVVCATMCGLVTSNTASFISDFLASDNSNTKSFFNIVDLINTPARINKHSNAAGYFVSWVIEVAEKITNYFRSLIGKEALSFFNTGKRDVDDWADTVTKLFNEVKCGRRDLDVTTATLINQLRDQGVAFTSTYRFTDKDIVSHVRRYVAEIDALINQYASLFTVARTTRPEPECCMLYGKPGCGKTILCGWICTQVIAKTMPLETISNEGFDPSAEIFQKGASEYMEGYHKHWCFVMDDFSQQVNALGATDSDAMNLIRMVNSWMYPLNYANVDNKGKVNFDSKFVLGTTNVTDLPNALRPVIVDPGAVFRRIHHPYMLCVAADWCAPGKKSTDAQALDSAKYAKYIEEHKKCPTHAWFLRRWDYSKKAENQPANPREISLEQLVEDIVAGINSRKANHEHSHDLLKREASEIIKQRLAEAELERSAELASQDVELQASSGFSFASSPFLHSALKRPIEILSLLPDNIRENLSSGARILQDAVPEDLKTSCESVIRSTHFLRSEIKKAMFNPTKFLEDNPKISKFMQWFGMTGVGVLVAGSIGFTIKSILDKFIPEQEPQLLDLLKLDEMIQESKLPDNNAFISKNMFTFAISSGDGSEVNIGTALAIEHQALLVPTHYLAEVERITEFASERFGSNSKLILKNGLNRDLRVDIGLEHFLSLKRVTIEGTEITIVKMPSSLSVRKLTPRFVKESDVNSTFFKGQIEICLLTARNQMLCDRRSTAKRVTQVCLNKRDQNFVTQAWKYKIQTERGDCGSMLVLNPSVKHTQNRSIMGMHFAGLPSAGVGYSNIITQEKVIKAMEELNVVRDCQPDSNICVDMQAITIPGSCMPYGKVQEGTRMRPKTALAKTPLHGAWGFPCGEEKIPALLAPKGDKVPLYNARQKYAKPLVWFDPSAFAACAHVATKPLFDLTKDHSRNVYTFDEAICGIPGKIKSVNRGTSSGYPFVVVGAVAKQDFFGDDMEFDLDNVNCDKLREMVDNIVTKAKANERSYIVYRDFLKDERRPPEKVASGDTRLISGAPIHYIAAFRMYFMDFIKAFTETRVDNGALVGINAYSEWGLVQDRLLANSTNIVAGDYSAFDASGQPQIYDIICDIINQWYNDSEENQRVRKVLWMDLVHSRHITGDGYDNTEISQWFHSLPSGHPMTTVVNCLYNQIAICWCYQDLVGFEKLSTYHDFVKEVVYGDDNALSIKDDVIDKFNQLTITKSMDKIGLKYTTEDKKEATEKFRSLKQIDVLKRAFHQDEFRGHVYAPLALRTILEMPYWCRDKKNSVAIMQDNVEQALMELSAHPEEVWDEWSPKISEAYEELGFRTKFPVDQGAYRSLFRHAEDPYS